MSEQARLKGTVYVGGLAPMVNAASLHAAFIPFGEIVDISLPKPEAPSSAELHRGFAYVEFEDPSDAAEAINNMDQAELFGRVIKVSAAKPQKNANEGLGSKIPVWEQEAWLAANAVSEEDKLDSQGTSGKEDRPDDPMQGLEGLDVAGPRMT